MIVQAKREQSHFDALYRNLAVDGEAEVSETQDPALQTLRSALGPLTGARILELGCGPARWSVSLACTTPARTIVACDVSLNGLRQAGRIARGAGVKERMHFVQADAHRLPFRNGGFDQVIGGAILHHLDLSQASPEIRRVVRPGGGAVFCENNGDSSILRLVRAALYRIRWFALETEDAHPLRAEELAHLAGRFRTCTVWVPYVTLFTTLAWRRPLRRGKPIFQMLDAMLSNPLTHGCSMSRWIRLEV